MTRDYVPLKDRPKITGEVWEIHPKIGKYPRYIKINDEVWYELMSEEPKK